MRKARMDVRSRLFVPAVTVRLIQPFTPLCISKIPPKRKKKIKKPRIYDPGHNSAGLKSGLAAFMPEDGAPQKGDSWRRSIMHAGLEQVLHEWLIVESREIQTPSTSSFTLHNFPAEAGTFWHSPAAYSQPRMANGTWGIRAKRCSPCGSRSRHLSVHLATRAPGEAHACQGNLGKASESSTQRQRRRSPLAWRNHMGDAEEFQILPEPPLNPGPLNTLQESSDVFRRCCLSSLLQTLCPVLLVAKM